MNNLRETVFSIARANAALTLSFAAIGLLLAASLLAWSLDRRMILGLNAWVKPIKFDLSTLVFVATVAVLLTLLREHGPAKMWIGAVVGLSMVVEDALIALQAARGVPSHMNFTTPLNSAIFGVMGLFILLNTLAVAWLLVLYLGGQPQLSPGLLWGIRLGLLVLLAGSVEGVLMVQHGGHTVGAADGGAGLPFLNWSTRAGDLRVAHFFALHALQLFPLAGWAFGRLGWPALTQRLAIVLTALLYVALVGWLFVRAQAGKPLLG